MRRENSFLSSDKETDIYYMIWENEEVEKKAVLQIAHGMVEFKERYDEFANYLADRGIVVVANDHLGHGKSVKSEYHYGFFAKQHGDKRVLDDIRKLRQIIKEQYKDLDYFMLGHSMGSFFVRKYMYTYPDDDIKGFIIMGTGYQNKAKVKMAYKLSDFMTRKKGAFYKSEKLNSMILGANDRFFKNEKMKNAWLTKDKDILEKYNKEPLNNFVFTASAYRDMLKVVLGLYKEENLKNMNENANVFIISGGSDPIGEMGKGVYNLYEDYKKRFKNINLKIIAADRHELLNETDRLDIFKYVYEFIISCLEKK